MRSAREPQSSRRSQKVTCPCLALVPFVLLVVQRPALIAQTARPVRIAYVFSDGNISGTMKAYKALLEERPDLRGRIALSFLTESLFEDVKPADLAAADVLVL